MRDGARLGILLGISIFLVFMSMGTVQGLSTAEYETVNVRTVQTDPFVKIVTDSLTTNNTHFVWEVSFKETNRTPSKFSGNIILADKKYKDGKYSLKSIVVDDNKTKTKLAKSVWEYNIPFVDKLKEPLKIIGEFDKDRNIKFEVRAGNGTAISVAQSAGYTTINATGLAFKLKDDGGAPEDGWNPTGTNFVLDYYWNAKTTGAIFSEFESDDTCSLVYNTTTYVLYECKSGETDGSGNDWTIRWHAFMDKPALLVEHEYHGTEKQSNVIDYNRDGSYETITSSGRQTFTANADTNLNVTEGWYGELTDDICMIGNQSKMNSWGYYGPDAGYDQIFLGRYYNGGGEHYFVDDNWTTEWFYNSSAGATYICQSEWQKFMASNTSFFNHTTPSEGTITATTGYFLNTSTSSGNVSNFTVQVGTDRIGYILVNNDTSSDQFYLLDGDNNILEWVNFTAGTNTSNATMFDNGNFMFRRTWSETDNSFQINTSYLTGGGGPTDAAPNSTIISPNSGITLSDSLTQQFRLRAWDDFVVNSMCMWSNSTGTWAETQCNTSTVVNNTAFNVTHTFPANGYYVWGAKAIDNASQATFSPNYTLTINLSSIAITIHEPQNTTYYSSTRPLQVTETSPTTDPDKWYYNIDGGTNTSFTPNTTISIPRDAHTINIWVNSTDGRWYTDNVITHIDYYKFVNTTNPSVVFETNISDFEVYINLTNSSGINDITGNITYNGTTYTATHANSSNLWKMSYPIYTELLDFANNTERTFSWNYSVNHVDDVRENNKTVDDTVNAYYSYAIEDYEVDPDNILEGQEITGNASILDLADNATTNITMWINFTGYYSALDSEVDGLKYYTLTNATGDIEGDTGTISTIVQLNVSGDGVIRLVNSSFYNVTVSTSGLNSCDWGDDGAALAYNFTHEHTEDNETVNISAEFQIWTEDTLNQTFRFNDTNTDQFVLCVTPANETYFTIAQIDYYGTNWSKRSQFLDHATLNNITNSEKLYVLDLTNSSELELSVRDEFYDPMPGVVVIAMKYEPDKGFKQVDAGKTDYTGKTYLNLEKGPNKYYSYRTYKYGELLDSQASSELTTSVTEKTIVLNPSGLFTPFRYMKDIQYSCSYNDATETVNCIITNVGGISFTATLEAFENTTLGNTPVCTDSATATHQLLSCALGNTTGKRFEWNLYMNWPNGIDTLIDSGYEINETNPFGEIGLFGASIIVLLMTFGGIAARRPEVPIVGTIAGLIMAFYMGIFTMPYQIIIAISVIGGFIAWRLST